MAMSELTSDEMGAKIEAEIKAEEARARVLALQLQLKMARDENSSIEKNLEPLQALGGLGSTMLSPQKTEGSSHPSRPQPHHIR